MQLGSELKIYLISSRQSFYFCEILQKMNYSVHAETDIDKAFEELNRSLREFHLVIFDDELPGQDGLLRMETLSGSDHCYSFLWITAKVNPGIINRAFNAGVIDFLIRKEDIASDQLLNSIEKSRYYIQKDQENKDLRKSAEELKAYKIHLEKVLKERTSEFLKTHHKLKESEGFFKAFADFTCTWESYRNLSGKVLYVTPAFEEITGYDKLDYLTGKISLMDLVYQEDRKLFTEMYGKSQAEETLKDFEFRIVTKNGEIKHLSVNSNSVYNQKGEKRGIRMSAKDISRRKLAERQIKESEEKFRVITEQSLIGICILQEKDVVYINKTIYNFIGYSPEELSYIPFSDFGKFVHSEDLPLVISQIQARQNGEQTSNIPSDYRILTKSGEIKWLSVQMNRIEFNQGQAILVTAIDNTERKIAERALKKSENLFRSLVEASSDWIWQVDANRIFTYCSPNVKEILGYSPEEIIGKTPFDFMSPEEATRVDRVLPEVNRSKAKIIKNLESKHLHKDGHVVLIETNGLPLWDENGNMTGYQGTNRDITERKQMAKRIIQTVIETEEKERHKYAKELHDGLSPLLSAVKLYINSMENVKDPKQAAYLVDKSNKIMDEAISIIVDISNNISPHVLINFGLEEAVKSYIKKIKSLNGIDINLECHINQRFELNMEATLLRAVVELVTNTLKYAGALHVVVRIAQYDSSIKLHYQDDGIGFDTNTLSEKGKDTIGLRNLNDRIKTLGGKVDIVSKVGKGMQADIEIIF